MAAAAAGPRDFGGPFNELDGNLVDLQVKCMKKLKNEASVLHGHFQTEIQGKLAEKHKKLQLKLQSEMEGELQIQSQELNRRLFALQKHCLLDLEKGVRAEAAAFVSSLKTKANDLEKETKELRELTTFEVTDVDADQVEIVQMRPAAVVSLKRSREAMESSATNCVRTAAAAQKNVKVKQEKLEAVAAGKEEAENELYSTRDCAMCLEYQKCILFLPCRDFLVCESCAETLQSASKPCPKCRAPITKVIRAILS
jgi:hypothetical protein